MHHALVFPAYTWPRSVLNTITFPFTYSTSNVYTWKYCMYPFLSSFCPSPSPLSPPLPGNQQASPCMSLVLLKVSSCYIKGSFSLELLPADGSGVKTELNWPFLFCTTLLLISSVCLSFCFGLQTFLLFRTDPLPAFNEDFFFSSTWI